MKAKLGGDSGSRPIGGVVLLLLLVLVLLLVHGTFFLFWLSWAGLARTCLAGLKGSFIMIDRGERVVFEGC